MHRQRVGSDASTSVGREEPDEESENGEFFDSFLARTRTALPATFRGGGGTWRGGVAWTVVGSSDALTTVSRMDGDQEG